MDEIKTGEYFRCKKYGRINKYLDSFYDDTEFNVNCEPNCTFVYPSKEEFISSIKHSKNIIDLIEVGDYVNRDLVIGKYQRPHDGQWQVDCGDVRYIGDDIETILTHEMYEQNCYKVGVENE